MKETAKECGLIAIHLFFSWPAIILKKLSDELNRIDDWLIDFFKIKGG